MYFTIYAKSNLDYRVKRAALHFVTLATVLTLSACSSSSNSTNGNDDQDSQTLLTYTVELQSAQEVPPVMGNTASGTANISLDPATGAITGDLQVLNLSCDAIAAHLHGAFTGNNGAVIFGLETSDNGQTWSVPEGSAITADQQSMFLNGGTYLNVHTADNPGGEVRGQIVPDGIDVIRNTLSGDQEVPAVSTSGSASSVLTVNQSTGAIWATVVTDLPEAAMMAHIHQAAAGTNGPVLIGLSQDAENPSAWRTMAGDTLDVDSLAAIDTAGLYFNVHTASNPNGEVRGQIIQMDESDESNNSSTTRLVSNVSELDGSETLLDIDTGLVWINDVQFCFAGVTTPEQSNCSVLGDMAVAGFTDWRLPNSAEMSDVTLAVDADESVEFNYINTSCAVMTTSDGWVFTENSTAPGQLSLVQPGNAGVRCVSGE